MKLRHADLETFRANPKAYVAQMRAAKHFRQSMYRYWQLAVRAFHKEGLGVSVAIERLEDSLRSHFAQNKVNERRIEDFSGQLARYIASFNTLGVVPVDIQPQLNMPLDETRYLTGEIARVDLIPSSSGYGVYVFLRGDGDWRRELRFPLLQAHFADEYACSLQEVRVGVYSVDRGVHEHFTYPLRDVDAAMAEIRGLLRRIK